MAILPIIQHPALILEEKCKVVKKFDKKLHQLLDDMHETMIEADGVGLAAPQVNKNLRIAIVEVSDEDGLLELVNPQIIYQSGEQTDIEGCLSFPGLYGTVSRYNVVTIMAQDRFGKMFELTAEGYFARAIQHELDHLNGILFTSKVIQYVKEEELESSEVQ